jgi:hypothetical protein
MQKWVAVYIQGFLDTGTWDPVAATQAAFTSANLNVCRATTWRVKRHPQMKTVLDLFVNSKKSPQELALEEMQRHLDAAEPGSVAAQRLLATKHALLRRMDAETDDAPPPPAPPEPVVQTAPREPESRIPVGARGIRKDGILIGYKTPDGQVVRLAPVKADIRS